MKKILLLLVLLVAVACNKDDGNTDNGQTTTLTVTVNSVQAFQATISWVLEGGVGQTLYKIVLNGNVLEETFNGNQYTMLNLQQETTYNGVVFAISQGGDETFQEFNFTTTTFVDTNTIYNGHLVLSTQEQVDTFFYTEITGSLTITGNNITNIEGLTSLISIGVGLNVTNTSSLQSLRGLQNVSVEASPDYDFAMLLLDNDVLSNVTDLQNFSERTTDLTVTRNSALSNLNGLATSNIVETITINEGPVENLNFLSNVEQVTNLRLLNLPNMSPTGTEGLNNLQSAASIILNGVGGLQNLSGLENLTTLTFQLEITNCPDLTSLIGLENLSAINGVQGLVLRNLENFVNMQGLTNLSTLRTLTLDNLSSLVNLMGLEGLQNINNIEITHLSALQNLEGLNNLIHVEYDLELIDLPNFTSMQGLENLESVASFFDTFSGFPGSIFRISNLPQLSSFQELNNLSFIGNFGLSNCPSLTNLDGLETASQTYSQGLFFGIYDNVNLIDFCGLSLWVGSNAYMGNPDPVFGNGYNPTLLQIASSSECSL